MSNTFGTSGLPDYDNWDSKTVEGNLRKAGLKDFDYQVVTHRGSYTIDLISKSQSTEEMAQLINKNASDYRVLVPYFKSPEGHLHLCPAKDAWRFIEKNSYR